MCELQVVLVLCVSLFADKTGGGDVFVCVCIHNTDVLHIVFVNFAFCRCAIALMFDSSIFTHKSPVLLFQNLTGLTYRVA